MMLKLLPLILTIALVSGCTTPMTPAIVYKTQEVKTAVAVFPDIPVIESFDSRVLKLKDNSTDGEVGQSYKFDWLTLMYRDRIFTDFLSQYRKAKTDAQAAGK
ncbi:hypothetical protein D3C87_323350 [compost metagenome]